MKVTVVVPLYNEVENIELLYHEISAALECYGDDQEFLFVDESSTDGTVEKLKQIAASDFRVKPLILRRNYGQTAAMKAGIDFASGEFIITMDGDLQNDPKDISMMVEHLEQGYDLVHGWRKNRKDAFINRKLPSKIANWIISKVTKFPIHDLGCTLKAIRAEIAKELELYGETHRFIPILAHRRGARCLEVVTHHRPRIHGQTKYGIGRTTRVILDLITVKYMIDFFASPMKIFGRFGLGAMGLGMLAAIATLLMKVFGNYDVTGNPLFVTSILLAITSVQFFSLGILGEVNSRIYYNQPGRQDYAVRDFINAVEFEPSLPFVTTRRAA